MSERYNTPDPGTQNWHEPLNENFDALETDVEIRAAGAPDPADFEPREGAKYLDTDTGEVYLGDGTDWNSIGEIGGGGGDATGRYLDEDGFSGPAEWENDGETETNDAIGDGSTVGGGQNNVAFSNGSIVSGGGDNVAGVDTDDGEEGRFATIGGGELNTVEGRHSVIGGGQENWIDDISLRSTIGGGRENFIDGWYATIAGGFGNEITSSTATICGGENNSALGTETFIGGGEDNVADGSYNIVVGGENNSSEGIRSFIGGGRDNVANGRRDVITGGEGNETLTWHTTVGGGEQNAALDEHSTVAGGLNNTADDTSATVGGGEDNEATGHAATVPGGENNTASGSYSLAAGRNAEAGSDGTFVFGDSTTTSITSSSSDQAIFQPRVGIGKPPGVVRLWVEGSEDDSTLLRIDDENGDRQFHVNRDGSVVVGDEPFPKEETFTLADLNTDTSDPDGIRLQNTNDRVWDIHTSAHWLRFNTHSGDDDTENVAYVDDSDGSWNQASDARLKKNIEPVGSVLEQVRDLDVVRYDFKNREQSRKNMGLIAQETADVFPEFAKRETEDDYWAIDYAGLSVVALRAIQEQQETIEELQEENEELRDRLEVVEEELDIESGD